MKKIAKFVKSSSVETHLRDIINELQNDLNEWKQMGQNLKSIIKMIGAEPKRYAQRLVKVSTSQVMR